MRQLTTQLISIYNFLQKDILKGRKSPLGLNIPQARWQVAEKYYIYQCVELIKRQNILPDPRHISDRWQSVSPGSLHNSTTSRHSVSGVMGTSVKCWSLLLRYTVRNIYGEQEMESKGLI